MNKTFTRLCVLVAGLVVLNTGYASSSVDEQALIFKLSGNTGIENNTKAITGKSDSIDAKTGNIIKIPPELKPADLDKDGYISVKEVTQTIDSFLEGSSKFNVERINRLIDFFFEQ